MPDAVVIGAGPNGLVAANLLADAGWTVEVLEAASEPGGAVRSGELTVPGFRHDLFSAFYPLALASPALRELHLENHGLRWRQAPTVLAHPLPDGSCVELTTDLERTAQSLDQLRPGDGRAWREMIAEWDRSSQALIDLIFRPFPPLRAGAGLFRALGALGVTRLARQAMLPVRRMSEERFAGSAPGLLLGGCALHSDIGPEGAGSGFYGWLLCCLAQRLGFPVPEGGAAALTDALVARLASRGGRVTCNTVVNRVVVRRGRAVAVGTTTGGMVDARRAVLADVPAPTLYGELIERSELPAALIADLRRFQWDLSTVKVDWALRSPLPWSAAGAGLAGTVHVADDFDNLTEFAAQLAMGQLPSRPFLVFAQQSRADPTRSPEGSETAWAYTHVPRSVLGDAAGQIALDPQAGDGSEEEWLEPFVERIEARIERLAPGFRSLVLGRHVFGPNGLSQNNRSLVGGAIGGGTSQLHQQLIFRPVPGCGRPETHIEGLYLASSSAHPGGGVHGASGANAARAALSRTTRLWSAALRRGLAAGRSRPG